MNKIYKIVWNAAQQAWVVVSELARGHVKASATSTASNEALSDKSTLALGKFGSGTLIGSVAVTLLTLSSTAQAAIVEGSVSNGAYAAIGTGSVADSPYSVAIGKNAHAGNGSMVASRSYAIGDSANATGIQTFAMGTNANASGVVTMALGDNAETSGFYSSAFGFVARALANYSLALGAYSNATAEGAIAIGNMSNVTGCQSTAIGQNNTVAGDCSTVIGRNVKTLNCQTNHIALAHDLNLTCATSSSKSTYIGHNIKAEANSGATWVVDCSTVIGSNMNFVANHSWGSGLARSSVIGNNINYNSYGQSYVTMMADSLTFKGDYLRDSNVIGRYVNISAYNSSGSGSWSGYRSVSDLNLLGSCVTLNSDNSITRTVATGSMIDVRTNNDGWITESGFIGNNININSSKYIYSYAIGSRINVNSSNGSVYGYMLGHLINIDQANGTDSNSFVAGRQITINNTCATRSLNTLMTAMGSTFTNVSGSMSPIYGYNINACHTDIYSSPMLGTYISTCHSLGGVSHYAEQQQIIRR